MPDRHDRKKVGHEHDCVHGTVPDSEKRKIFQGGQATPPVMTLAGDAGQQVGL